MKEGPLFQKNNRVAMGSGFMRLSHFYLLNLLYNMVLSAIDGCNCTSEGIINSCHCEGEFSKIRYNRTIHKLSLENGNVNHILEDSFNSYKGCLIDLTITWSKSLDKIDDNIFQDMPMLNSVRITHTALKHLPLMKGLGISSIMQMIDFESNEIQRITTNNVNVRVEQFSIDYNSITSIDAWSFNGSEIEKLSLKGNSGLSQLYRDSFRGLRSLRDLDLSGTSISYLPTLGLEDLEVLKIRETHTLQIIPSVYDLPKLQVAHLTYTFHCCAFHNPEKHDPYRHKKYLQHRKELCTEDQSRLERDMFDESFGDIFDKNNHSSSNLMYEDNGISEDGSIRGSSKEINFNEIMDEKFHTGAVNVENNKIHAVCGDLTGKLIFCEPKPDALNPCEDMMSWIWLRISVWFVLSTAIFGNIAVLIVLLFSRTENSVPRFLMCNLAFADLLMAIYLTMMAVMDIISSQVYFNYAYDWQRGVGCKIAGFLTVFASQLSLFTLSLLTLERWFAIKHALYLNLLDLQLTKIIMIGGWSYSLLMAGLPLVGVSSYSSTSICLPMATQNSLSEAYIIIILLVSGCAFFLMCICYSQIYQSLSKETRHSIGEGSLARKMTILVGTNFICWAPVAFFSLTAVAGYPLITISQSKILLVFIYPINSCANPYLYAILTKQFRKDFISLISRFVSCKRTRHSNGSNFRPISNDVPPTFTTAETLL